MSDRVIVRKKSKSDVTLTDLNGFKVKDEVTELTKFFTKNQLERSQSFNRAVNAGMLIPIHEEKNVSSNALKRHFVIIKHIPGELGLPGIGKTLIKDKTLTSELVTLNEIPTLVNSPGFVTAKDNGWITTEYVNDKKALDPDKTVVVIPKQTPQLGIARTNSLLSKFSNERISVVVIGYDNISVTVRCFDALLQNSNVVKQIIYVDNGSKQVSYLESLYKDKVEFIKLKTNHGVIIPRNVGIRKCTEDYIFILDNDQFVCKDWDLEMLLFMENKQCDVVGVEGWLSDDKHNAIRKLNNTEVVPPTYVGAGGLLVKRKVFETVGLYDEGFSPAYYEDPDLCFRLLNAGIDVGWCREDIVVHLGHSTLHKQKDFDDSKVHQSSKKYFINKYNKPIRKICVLLPNVIVNKDIYDKIDTLPDKENIDFCFINSSLANFNSFEKNRDNVFILTTVDDSKETLINTLYNNFSSEYFLLCNDIGDLVNIEFNALFTNVKKEIRYLNNKTFLFYREYNIDVLLQYIEMLEVGDFPASALADFISQYQIDFNSVVEAGPLSKFAEVFNNVDYEYVLNYNLSNKKDIFVGLNYLNRDLFSVFKNKNMPNKFLLVERYNKQNYNLYDNKILQQLDIKIFEEINDKYAILYGSFKKKDVFFSTLTATYNRRRYIEESIDSILKQTCDDYEVIIVDDASTDFSKSRLLERYLLNEKIKFVFLYKNRGPGGARNRGIPFANGKYIVIQDSDDVSSITRLATAKARLELVPDIDVFYTDYVLCDINMKQLNKVSGSACTIFKLSSGNCIPHLTTIFKTDMLSFHKYPEESSSVDYGLLLDLLYHQARFDYLKTITSFCRKNTRGISYGVLRDDQYHRAKGWSDKYTQLIKSGLGKCDWK